MSLGELWLKGSKTVTNERILFLLPLFLDLILFGPLAFTSAKVIDIKLTLVTSLPTIQNLLPDAASFGGTQSVMNMGYPGTLTVGFIGTIFAFAVVPFLTGGYLGTIIQEYRGNEERQTFIALSSKYFVRLVIMRIVIMVAFWGLIILLKTIPIVSSIMVGILIFISVLLLFWDLSIVYDNLDLVPALFKAYTVIKQNTASVVNALLPIIIFLMPLTLGASLLVGSFLFLLVILVYAYLGAVIVSGIAYLYITLAAKTQIEK